MADLRARVKSRLTENIRSGYDPYYQLHFSYVRPSPGRYSWQWFWDSCFHAISLAWVEPQMAWNELRMLLASQNPDGFIGHVIYWGRFGAFRAAGFMQTPPHMWRRRHSGMIQPPVLAQALERVHELSPNRTLLKEMLPLAQRFYDWIHRFRAVGDTGLIFVVSPYETGLDNSPAYDQTLGRHRPSRRQLLVSNRWLDFKNMLSLPRKGRLAVVDTMMNSLFAEGMRSLANLWCYLGDMDRAARNVSIAERTENSLHDRCWDEQHGQYVHLWVDKDADVRQTTALNHARPLPVSTVASLFPLVLESTPQDRKQTIMDRHLTNRAEYWLPYPLPSVARSDPAFDPSSESLIWRGQTNMPVNWMLVRGLQRSGFGDQANHISDRSRVMAERAGFYEFYNPLTGDGLRGTDFGWATIIIDMGA